MNKEKTVWMSDAMHDSTLIKAFTNVEIEAELEAAGQVGSDPADRVVGDAMRRNKSGEPLPANRFPQSLHVSRKGKRYSKLPEMFSAGGFWVVSAACAEIMGQFNLGKSSLYPVAFFQHDQKTPIDGEYFYLNFGETLKAFDPDQTPNVRVYGLIKSPPTGFWEIPVNVVDGDVAINKSALNGPDLWLDPSVPKKFFLSDDLVQALKKAKLTRRFKLKKCRIV